MKLSSILLCCLFAASPGLAEPVATLSGIAEVRDGDGILFGEVEVRLQGIAAPELGERGGQESFRNLARLARGKSVTCELDGTVANRRPVGICYLDGEDLAEQQVLQGHARDCPRYSRGRYRQAEREARSGGTDLSAIYPLPGYC